MKRTINLANSKEKGLTDIEKEPQLLVGNQFLKIEEPKAANP